MGDLAFDPSAPVTVTDRHQVDLVTRCADSTTFEVVQWLPTLTRGELHALRPAIRRAGVRKEYPFKCAGCGGPVVLKSLTDHGHYFSHVEKAAAAGAGCPFREARGPSEADLDRMRYHGQREGPRHRRTKELIARTVRADPRFEEPVIEKVWRSFIEGYRRPDVRSALGRLHVVFEAQVSNTYPQVVAERTEFYRENGMLCFWIFDEFPSRTWRTLHADAFCANKRHLFVVDDQSAVESERQSRALLRAYRQHPGVRPAKDSDTKRTILEPIIEERFDLVAFDMLQCDVQTQTACLFDAELVERRVRHKVLCAAAQAHYQVEPLRRDIQDLLQTSYHIKTERLEAWAALVCAIESASFDCAIGTAHANPAGLLNLVFDHYPDVVGLLVETLQRLDLNTEKINRGAWGQRARAVAGGRYQNAGPPPQHPGSRRLLNWLYP